MITNGKKHHSLAATNLSALFKRISLNHDGDIHCLSYSGSPLYNLNKYIANILKAYVRDENDNAKNSTTFSNYIRNVLHIYNM